MKLLADSCLDANTAAAFITFVSQNLGKLIAPEKIVNATNFESQVLNHLKEVALQKTVRVDILATVCTRLVNYLTINKVKPDKNQMDNLKKFIKIDFIPNDLRLTMAQDLVSSDNASLKMIMADPEIGKMLLKRM